MDEFKAWMWETLIELGLSFIAVIIIIGCLWGFVLVIKFLA